MYADDELDAAAEVTKRFYKDYKKVDRLPDVAFGGVPFYHVHAEDPEQSRDVYGTIRDGLLIDVQWSFNRGLIDRKASDALIDQVMPTFKPTS
ncbi:hypothetical protein [Nocardioides sp. NPDC047086]|uniref:hypothetical protein n=1 Tax=Nocardioides sp. NPDC047086 TaxID=3154810 RepID=UPI0033CCF871